jgi:hypothetical protein
VTLASAADDRPTIAEQRRSPRAIFEGFRRQHDSGAKVALMGVGEPRQEIDEQVAARMEELAADAAKSDCQLKSCENFG